ncbi:hypothetical protein THRCLA_05327 [Thraustotheca clavata]|uniref:Uncharacterized protein n=1 Tax=Thraustotheca clavata TaxID=74557 RepID=A0A1V9ZWX5_9STRA|nr:hypothetical protein THRCLA_05327 [Thraustotheca clavata]
MFIYSRRRKVPIQLSEEHYSVLSSPDLANVGAWKYCLPINPQQCGSSRGIKRTIFETPATRPCRSAVLHVLLENILEVISELNLPAFPYFGTVLGAWRDEGIIPHTRDIDVIFPADTDWDRVKAIMWQRGFYVFDDYIRRACFAAHHPLAPLLYSKNSKLVDDGGHSHGTPYLDLYSWEEKQSKIVIQTAAEALPKHHIFPLNCHEKILGMSIPSIVYPEALFHSEYGTTYTKDPDLQLAQCESYCDYQLLKNTTILQF